MEFIAGKWLIFGIGLILGGASGLFLAAILGAAHRGEYEHDVIRAYQDGFEHGQKSLMAAEILEMAGKV